MGRRSVNTTKSGKFMNPTDQARKEARKRELKKNKKQRMAVRQAVLKSKDPLQLLEETALYDKQEYDPSVQAQLNERVIQEKRRKLLETFDRLVILYRKEDAEYASRLLAARQDYDKKRQNMMLYYEQVKLAERVKASDIPLPDIPQVQMGLVTSDIPLPPGVYTKSILKKPFGAPGLPPGILPLGRKPPGPPSGPPPELSDSDTEEANSEVLAKQRKIRFMDPEPSQATDSQASLLIRNPQSAFSGGTVPPSQIPLPPPTGLPSFTGLIRPGFPGAPQPGQIRFNLPQAGGPVLSAPPNLHPRDPLDSIELVSHQPGNQSSAFSAATVGLTSGTTIEAKPLLKNLIGDATRFVPTALKVRRTTRDATGRLVITGGGVSATGTGKPSSAPFDRVSRADEATSKAARTTGTDVAYDEFMREMESLL